MHNSKMKNNGPLSGLLVLDLTRVLVGPYCTMILSDLGARVIKVEAPEVGDDSRNFGPFIEDQSAYFMSLNRNKESIALNLKNAKDKKIFEKILPKADILIENFKPGRLNKWGYDWENLKNNYPNLIYQSTMKRFQLSLKNIFWSIQEILKMFGFP